MLFKLLLIPAAFILASPAVAQGGLLPKGDPKDLDAGRAKGPSAAPPPARPSCVDDLVNPPGGHGQFTKDGKFLYLLGQMGQEPAKEARSGKGAKKGKGGASKSKGEAAQVPKVKLGLFRVTLATGKAEPLVALEHAGPSSLLLHEGAVSAVAFQGPDAACLSGPAAVVSISFIKQEDKAVLTQGSYQIATAPASRLLFDLETRQLLEVDAATFQTRGLRKIGAQERPLYFSPATRRLVTWYSGDKQRGLIAYRSDDDPAPRRLAVAPGDRVVQARSRFAVVRLDAAKNTIKIQEIGEWTGVKKPGVFTLSLPPAFAVKGAAVELHFDRRLALVQGATLAAKHRWQRAFVFDYEKSTLLGTIQVTGSQYLDFGGIDPTGARLFFEVREQGDGLTVGGRLFHVASRSTKEVGLGLPR